MEGPQRPFIRRLLDRSQQKHTSGAPPSLGVELGLDIVEMIMEAEKQFEFDIPDQDAARLVTVGSLYDYIVAHAPSVSDASRVGLYSGPDWEKLLSVIEAETAVKREHLVPSARFVQDLHLD